MGSAPYPHPPPPPSFAFPRLTSLAGALAEVDEALRRKQAAEAEAADRMLTDVVGPEEVATVVSKWTGIPVNKLQASGRRDGDARDGDGGMGRCMGCSGYVQ